MRSHFRARELIVQSDNTHAIKPTDIILFCTFRDEAARLPYFMQYYRDLGVDHFFMVDNGSTDGSADALNTASDVSLWRTEAPYARSRYGVDWLTHLRGKYGHNKWCLTVDVDEFFVYPFCDTRPLRALADWLDASEVRSFGAMLLDMYPKGAIQDAVYTPGDDPFQTVQWFDPGNYVMSKNPLLKNLWIQGGPRARAFFSGKPKQAPALNKIPFVKWKRHYAYVSSTHMMLPRGLNLVYDEGGGEKTSGILLHAKFLNTFTDHAAQEAARGQHYNEGIEYRSYVADENSQTDLWTEWSEQYINWRQLEVLGLMSKGNWA